MEENVLLVLNFEQICRLCLSNIGGMSNLSQDSQLQAQVQQFTGLDVTNMDGLPLNICYKCRYIVEVACELQHTAEKSHQLLTKAQENDEDHDTKEPNTINDISPEVSNEIELASELTRKIKAKYLTCQICLTRFETLELTELHIDTHYEKSILIPYHKQPKPYLCQICNSTVKLKTLIEHHREHLGVNPYVCKVEGCTFIGKNLSLYRHHEQTHKPQSFTCPTCGVGFKRLWTLQSHEKRGCWINQRKQPLVKWDDRPRKYECKYPGCTKNYLSRSHLRIHEATHDSSKKFVCDLCEDAVYTSRSQLVRHMRVHNQSRVWRCDRCPQSFNDYALFYRHRVSAHGHWRQLKCQYCLRRCNKEENLKKHMMLCKQSLQMTNQVLE